MGILQSIKNWFKSKEREEIQQVIGNPVAIPVPETKEEEYDSEPTKQYRICKRLGTITLVVLMDDTVLSKEDPDSSIFNQVPNLKKEEIEKLFAVTFHIEEEEEGEDIDDEEEETKKEIPTDAYLVLRENPLFKVEGDKVIITDVPVAIPADIVADFIEILEKTKYAKSTGADTKELDIRFESLLYFWLKLVNSPIKDRNSVLKYCKRNNVRLSKRGNIIGYRRVLKHKVSEKVDETFIAAKKHYDKVRAWKKSPTKFSLVDVDGNLVAKENAKLKKDDVVIGNLHELYLKGDSSTGQDLYTSKHNRGKYVFPIPSLYKMEGEKPDPDLSNCHSGGLHVANVNFNYSSFGETPVVVLVNPMRAIYVPRGDDGKFRTSEMYIVDINPNGYGVHIDDAFIEAADEAYNDITMEQLKQVVKDKNMDSITIGPKYKPETTEKEVKSILDIMKSRVKQVV